MAMTHRYMDYLNKAVGIAPANSQEELQAAQTIAGLMEGHGLEAQIEEFDAPALSGLLGPALSVVMFLGIVLAGVGVPVLAFVGFVLALVPTVRAGLHFLGHTSSASLGPTARSQNVVACHRATGPLVERGNRPIVIVAHYDTPRESFLCNPAVAPFLPVCTRVARYAAFATALCGFVQILLFLPASVRGVFWVIGMVAALPALILAVASVYERVAPCTLGANDNKASVAALLGVLENVRPGAVLPEVESPAEPSAAEAAAEGEKDVPPAADADSGSDANAMPVPAEEAAPAPAPAPEPVSVLGVRHGGEVLRSLGILPEDCELVYNLEVASAPAPAPAAPAADASVAEAPAPAGATAPMAPVAADREPAAEPAPLSQTADLGATREDLLADGRFSLVMDEDPRSVGPLDASGLTNLDDGYDVEATHPAPAVRPEAPSDPEWGKTDYRPQLSSVARRASLFDLPDPSAAAADPFGTDPSATRVQAPSAVAGGAVAPAPAAPSGTPAPVVEPIQKIVPAAAADSAKRALGGLGGLFDRVKSRFGGHRDEEESWEDEGSEGSSSEDGGVWRGGAAPRAGLRLVGEDEGVGQGDRAGEAEGASFSLVGNEDADGADSASDSEGSVPTEDELREAILRLGDDELVSHDIWFVALGASDLDHAGMRAFLAQHRKDIRGSFVVNLDCVGAGELTLLTHEGLEGTRRADRRLGRLLTRAADDLHVPMATASFDWSETDATPAMRSSLRSMTIMGLDGAGLPALSHSATDVPQNVSGDQAASVAQVVTEMIRRS